MIFFGCGQVEEKGTIVHKDSAKTTVDTIIKEKTAFAGIYNNKIYIDSIEPYFKFRDIERIDSLWLEIDNVDMFSLKQVMFSPKYIISKFNKDTVPIIDYTFILGNLKNKPDQLDIILFLDMCQFWGKSLLIVSVDKNHDVFDVENLDRSGGDAGYFSKVEINYNDFFNYNIKVTDGCFPSEVPPNTTKYNKYCYKTFKINDNSTFTENIIRHDSSIIICPK